MKTGRTAGVLAAALALLALLVGLRVLRQNLRSGPPASATRSAFPPPTASAGPAHPSFLYGLVTTVDGAAYQGRLRWGGGEEAFWGDYFNGAKKANPWVVHIPPGQLPMERQPFRIFGLQVASRERPVDLNRLFMARFGDIARIEASGRDVRITLKSGTAFELDRFSASDFDDGVRVWDAAHGVVDLDSLRIRAIDLRPSPGAGQEARQENGPAPNQLHGTVRTRQGEEFSGFVEWDRQQCLGSDELAGHTAAGDRSIPFSAIRSIARHSSDSTRVILLDGGDLVLSGTRAVGQENRGVYVDDPRYGRVLVSWDSFERLEFSPGAGGPAYGDFPPGGPLTGTVTTRDGRHLVGRLVYDLDESEFTETLDAPSRGVDYTIPFAMIASVVLPGPDEPAAQHATVTLHSGRELHLERAGDLGKANAGILIFASGQQRPEYVPWTAVAQVTFNRPPASYPPLDAH
ncbi:hypothetical protein [Paludibaculum fermentans]|uniref:hypothetical protein n=1 Tax=Paludibaculum fermentans TaxID=1473598 RepID=UPI003EB92E7C